MNWTDVANAENSRDANLGPLSEITLPVTPHLANTYLIFRMTDCVVSFLVYAISIYIYIYIYIYYMDSNRPSVCTCPPTLHIGHSRYFAMGTEVTVCSSGAPSAGLADALGNVRSVSRSRLSLSISQATISIYCPVHDTLSLLGEFSGGFRF